MLGTDFAGKIWHRLAASPWLLGWLILGMSHRNGDTGAKRGCPLARYIHFKYQPRVAFLATTDLCHFPVA